MQIHTINTDHYLLSDLDARSIASEWYDGQWSALYALSSSGTILDGCTAEIDAILANLSMDDIDANARYKLPLLREYVIWHGERGPQDVWSSLTW